MLVSTTRTGESGYFTTQLKYAVTCLGIAGIESGLDTIYRCRKIASGCGTLNLTKNVLLPRVKSMLYCNVVPPFTKEVLHTNVFHN